MDVAKILQTGELAGTRYVLSPLRIAPQGRQGAHLGRFAGSSLEFREHREYQPGDDLRRLDWGAFARSDKLTVKLFQQEVQPHLDLLIDGSRSMGHVGDAKATATLGLAAALVTAASQASFSHCAWLASEGCRQIHGGTGRPSTWQQVSLDASGNPSLAMDRRPPSWRPRSIRIFVSDLLWMGDPRPFLARLTERASSTTIVQLLSAQDVSPDATGYVKLIDSETGEEHTLRLDKESLQLYLDAFRRHNEAWREAARRAGVAIVSLIAEQVLESWKLDALVAARILQVKA